MRSFTENVNLIERLVIVTGANSGKNYNPINFKMF